MQHRIILRLIVIQMTSISRSTIGTVFLRKRLVFSLGVSLRHYSQDMALFSSTSLWIQQRLVKEEFSTPNIWQERSLHWGTFVYAKLKGHKMSHSDLSSQWKYHNVFFWEWAMRKTFWRRCLVVMLFLNIHEKNICTGEIWNPLLWCKHNYIRCSLNNVNLMNACIRLLCRNLQHDFHVLHCDLRKIF